MYKIYFLILNQIISNEIINNIAYLLNKIIIINNFAYLLNKFMYVHVCNTYAKSSNLIK